MKKLQTIARNIGVKVMEAGVLFTAVLPGKVFAQLTVPEQPEGTADNLIEGDESVFVEIANILLLILGAIAVIMLIIGGFRYVISGGDSNAVESAKNTILYAIIGIIVAFLSYAAVKFLLSNLGADTTGTIG